MSRILVAVFGAMLVAAVGCQSEDKNDDMKQSSSAMKTSADVCAHCPGVQTASAEGKCSACGAEVAKK